MNEMRSLVDALNKHSYNYYVLDKPTISDSEYDALYDKLLEITGRDILLKNSIAHIPYLDLSNLSATSAKGMAQFEYYPDAIVNLSSNNIVDLSTVSI